MTPRKGEASQPVPTVQHPHSYTASSAVEAIQRSHVSGIVADAFRKAVKAVAR